MSCVTIRWHNKIVLFLILLKIVTFIIFQSIYCGIIIIIILVTTTSGSLLTTETVVNTMKVKLITLHHTLFYLFYDEYHIAVLDCPNLSQIIYLSFPRKVKPTQTEITSQHMVLYTYYNWVTSLLLQFTKKGTDRNLEITDQLVSHL